MRSFLSGFRSVRLLIVAAGLILFAYSRISNALFYTKTIAEVLRTEDRCVPAGAHFDAATDCVTAIATSGGKRVSRYTAVHLSYTSPADGSSHEGVLIPLGRQATQAEKLRPGDHLQIFANDKNPNDIKAD
jgi:hypothetical protein